MKKALNKDKLKKYNIAIIVIAVIWIGKGFIHSNLKFEEHADKNQRAI